MAMPSAAASVRANAYGTVGRVAATVSFAGPGVTARVSTSRTSGTGKQVQRHEPRTPTAAAYSPLAPPTGRPVSAELTKSETRALLRSSRRSRSSASGPVLVSVTPSAMIAALSFSSVERYSV